VGNLCVVVNDKQTVTAIKSDMSLLIRANWSNPPAHGARIVHMVLTQTEMRNQW
jgi:aspartate/tyrosine/aromatic aminotransferase